MEQVWEQTPLTAGDIRVNREATEPSLARASSVLSRGEGMGSPSLVSQAGEARAHVRSVGEWGAAGLSPALYVTQSVTL